MTQAVVRALEGALAQEGRPLAERIADIARDARRLGGRRRGRAVKKRKQPSIGDAHDEPAQKGLPLLPLHGDLSPADAKKVFMGDKSTWPSGKRVTILMLSPGQPERAVALREIYKMSEDDYGQYFTQAAFAGKVSAPPKDVGSPAQMKQAIAANPGAIGYVKKEDVDDTVKPVLKLQ